LWIGIGAISPGIANHRARQIATMQSSFAGLLAGLAFAIFLIYLLIVVNFQFVARSIDLISRYLRLGRIVWILFVTHTTISVPALTGSIMCMAWPRRIAFW